MSNTGAQPKQNSKNQTVRLSIDVPVEIAELLIAKGPALLESLASELRQARQSIEIDHSREVFDAEQEVRKEHHRKIALVAYREWRNGSTSKEKPDRN
jgi:hypothetical protein